MIVKFLAARWRIIVALGVLAQPASMPMARADEARLRGEYVVTLLGLTIGRGSWDVRLAPDHYIVSGEGRSAGLGVLVSSGRGHATADGGMEAGKLDPHRYEYASSTSRKYDDVRVLFQDGTVSAAHTEPPLGRNRHRIPLQPEHQKGVLDPIAALLMPAPGPLGPAACARDVPVFDGRMRYDLHFRFSRIEQVKTESGYHGPVVVCAVRFAPIAGYVPDRPAIKYLTGLTTMEAWFAPVGGTGIVVPWKVVIPTPFGTAMLAAESFRVGEE